MDLSDSQLSALEELVDELMKTSPEEEKGESLLEGRRTQ